MSENSLPELPIVIVGKDRTRMTCAVIDALLNHIKNAKPYFICVSDRSRAGHDKVVESHLNEIGVSNHIVIRTLPEEDRYGWGAAMNLGLSCAFDVCQDATCALVVDNDWILQRDLDIDKYLYAFAFSSIGAITFKHIYFGTNVSLKEVTLSAGDTYLLRSKGSEERYSFTAELGCMLLTKRLYGDYGKFKENCKTDSTEWDFCDWYNTLSDERKNTYGLWFATDKELRHDSLNGIGHVFTHVGIVSQHEGRHQWDCPEEYKDLSDDKKDAAMCADAVRQLHKENVQVVRETKKLLSRPLVSEPAAPFINWARYFDKVYCLSYLTESNPKLKRLKIELERIDLLHSPVFEMRYDVRIRGDERLSEKYANLSSIEAYRFEAIAFLRILKEAKCLKYNRICILEDDVAFLKNKAEIQRILDNLPDAPAIQMDKAVWTDRDLEALNNPIREENGFIYSKHNFLASGCSIFNSEGIEKAIGQIEESNLPIDRLGITFGERLAVAKKNLCVQVFYDTSEGAKRADANGNHCAYTKQNIDYSEYSVPEGYGRDVFYKEEVKDTSVVIPWEKYFDKVFCLFWTARISERMPRLRNELQRVDLLSSPIFEWAWDANSSLEDGIRHETDWDNVGDVYKVYAVHYVNFMKNALALGYRRILVIEDDIAFLKDKSRIIDMLESMPDTPFVQMDKFIWSDDKTEEFRKAKEKGEKYVISKYGFSSATCNAYTREGMKTYIETIEKRKCANDNFGFFVPEQVSIAIDPVAVQVVYQKSLYSTNLQSSVRDRQMQQWHSLYARQGIDEKYSAYAVPEGYDMQHVYVEKSGYDEKRNLREEIKDTHPGMHFNRKSLLDLVDSIGMDNIKVLEIGSCMGDSAEVFLMSEKVRSITCVDPWTDIHSDNPCNTHLNMSEKERTFDETVLRFGDRVEKFKGTFRDFIEKKSDSLHDYDIVYLDALHDYESVKNDIRMINEVIKPRLGIAGHDYCPNHEHLKGVAQAVDEAFHGDIEIFDDTSWLHRNEKIKPKKKKGRKFVSVYAIAKNEASVAARWYECVKEADEVCVLDTGSTDDTVKILRDLGADVTVKTYEDWSFAVARNDSMKLVSPESEILFTLDLDETIASGWRKKLEDAWIAEEEKGKNPVGAAYKYIWSFYDDGREMQSFAVRKVHKNGVGKWKYRCHELLQEVNGYSFFIEGFVVEHHQNRQTSRSKYLGLLEKDAKEMPEDDRSAYYYARELMYEGRWEEAIEEFKRHLMLSSAWWTCERASSMRNIAYCYRHLKNEDEYELWLWKSAEEDKTNREATYFLGEKAMEQKDYRTAVKVFERCVAIEEPSLEYISMPLVWSARPWFLYAQALWWVNRWNDAVEASKKAMEIEPDNAEVRSQYENMKATRDRYAEGKK